VAYVDSTTGTGNSATPSVAVPTGTAAGQIALLFLTTDSPTTQIDAGDEPTGFTVFNQVDMTGDGGHAAALWKRLTGADAGSYTFGNLSIASEYTLQCILFDGRHATDPPVATQNVQNTPQSSPITVTATGVTAVAGDDLAWASSPDVTAVDVGNGHDAPSGFTEVEDAEGADWTNLSIAYQANVSAGATGDISGTFNLTSNTAGWVAYLVRVPAAAAAGGASPNFLTLLGVGA
jgi:hypothetical protein